DDRNHRNAEFISFRHGNFFLAHIDYKDRVRQTVHSFDARKRFVQTLPFAIEFDALFLGQFFITAIGLHRFQIFEPLDRFLYGLKIRQETAQPALVDIILSSALGFLADSVLGLTLRAHEQHCLAAILSNRVGDILKRLAKHLLRLLQIDNIYAVALAENIFLHLRVPTAHLVTEVNTGLQQLFHRNRNQTAFSLVNWFYVLVATAAFTLKATNQKSRQWILLK